MKETSSRAAGRRTMLACAMLLCSLAAMAIEPADSVADALVAARPDSVATTAAPQEDTNRDWWYLLRKGQLDVKDTTVVYPKFLKFCIDVYNWGDRFFNTYDPAYVEGTGKKWKARMVNDNWTDSYSLDFKNDDLRMLMLSDMNVNLGAYIQFMAVSVGYSLDLNSIFKGKRNNHSRLETSFTCALFNFDLNYTRNSGTYIRRMTGIDDNTPFIKSSFPGVDLASLNVSAYYFFNHKRYSHGAAYSFSRYQRRSAGSWLVGFGYSNLNVSMDFTTLAPELQQLYTKHSDFLKFHYNSYCALFGYGYNWVWHPKWLFNVTVMPSIGANHCYEDSSDGSGTQFALNVQGQLALVFNHRALFAGVIGKVSGNWYTSRTLSLFNAIEHFSAHVGVRF